MEGRSARVRRDRIRIGVVVLAFAAAGGSDVRAEVAQAPLERGAHSRVRETSRFELVIDNDLFAGRGADRDYTGGFGMTVPLVCPLRRLSNRLGRAGTPLARAGLVVFTPDDIARPDAIADDRPYANLLYVDVSRYAVDSTGLWARQSTLTLGLLGTPVAESMQSAIHRSMDLVEPRGFSHQIADGGEPTGRFAVSRYRLLSARAAGPLRLDAKLSLEGSLGYLTDAAVSVGARFGRFRSPWWTFSDGLSDYAAQPPLPASYGAAEWFVFAGVQARARAYNAFLRGQFRSSDVVVSRDNVQSLLGQAWIGLVADTGRWRARYTLRFQTTELRRGQGSRTSFWGGLAIARSF